MSEEKIKVSHVNIRLSISILLLKLLLIEGIAASLVIFVHSSLFILAGEKLMNFGLQFFNIYLVIFLVLLKITLTAFVILQWLNEYYEITSTVVYHRKGLIFKTEEKYRLEPIKLVEVTQGVFGRILNYGNIYLYNEVIDKREEMYMIHNPMRYAKVIEDLLPYASKRKKILREHIIEKNIYDTE